MQPLAARVWRTMRRFAMVSRGGRVVAAVSGGADSVALAYLLAELAGDGRLALAGIAHFNHMLRGDASDEDQRFSERLANVLAVRFDTERWTSHAPGEDAARHARYAFLERARERLGADRLAVGHTRDDQAETFLLRIVRGAGTRGLTGIHPVSGHVIRPLVDVSHAELQAYLAARGVQYREDASNLDIRFARNRVRHELIPLLQQRFSPAIVDVLAREAELARDDAELLDELAARASEELIRREAEAPAVDVAGLLTAPRAIATRVVRKALAEASGDRFMGFDHVEAVLALAVTGEPSAVDLPGVRVEHRGARLVFKKSTGPRSKAVGRRPEAGGRGFDYLLAVPGEILVPEAGCVVSAERAERAPAELFAKGNVAVVQGTHLGRALRVRSRRAGDSFHPLGLGGTKKLQDFLVDKKIRRAERDRIPLVVDEKDRILWVGGLTIADEFRVTDGTQSVVILRLKDVAGGQA